MDLTAELVKVNRFLPCSGFPAQAPAAQRAMLSVFSHSLHEAERMGIQPNQVGQNH